MTIALPEPDIVLQHVSATQIGQFQDCPRKWFFRYVMGHRYPASRAMTYGSDVHQEFEDHYLKGSPPELPETLHAFEHGLVPDKSDVLGIEFDVSGLDLRFLDDRVGPRLLGYIDLLWARDGQLPLRVRDWKTRSGFSYCPDENELKTDTQAVLYSLCAFEEMRRKDVDIGDELVFEHVNLLRKDRGGPDHLVVATTIEREHAHSYVRQHLEPVVVEMNKEARKALEHDDVPNLQDLKQKKAEDYSVSPRDKRVLKATRPIKTACFKYGRCEHWDNCYAVEYESVAERMQKAAADRDWGVDDILGGADDILPNTTPTPTNGEADMPTTLDELLGNFESEPDPQTEPPSEQHDDAPKNGANGKVPPSDGDLDALLGGGPVPEPMAKPDPELATDPELTTEPEPATETESATNPAPNILPPDHEPDIEPLTLDRMYVEDFPWTDCDGLGPAGEKALLAHFAERGITQMSQVTESFDFKDVKGIGAKTAQGIRAEFEKFRKFVPEGHGEKPEEPQEQEASEPLMTFVEARQAYVDSGAAAVDVQKLSETDREAYKIWLRSDEAQKAREDRAWRENNPDYAPAEESAGSAPAAESVKQPTKSESDAYLEGIAERGEQLRQKAQHPTPKGIKRPQVLDRIDQIWVSSKVQVQRYEPIEVGFVIHVDRGDDVVALTIEGRELAEHLARKEALALEEDESGN